LTEFAIDRTSEMSDGAAGEGVLRMQFDIRRLGKQHRKEIMSRLKIGAALGLTLLAGSLCLGQDALVPHRTKKKASNPSNVATENAGSTTAAAARPVDPKEYVIGEADLLHVNVYKEAELSGNAIVRPDGMISLALVNEVRVSGKTPLQVQQQLTESLKSYIVDPQVTVTVVDVRSKSVYVTGEVQRPDAYALLMPMTVLQILARAGGTTIYASRNAIFVLRNVNGKQEKIPFHYNDVMKGKKSAQDIQLQPGDTVVVP
jgi:polysaccharide export outer membrane protein